MGFPDTGKIAENSMTTSASAQKHPPTPVALVLFSLALLLLPTCGADDSDSSGDDSDIPLYVECFDGETSGAEASALRSPPKAGGDDEGSDWPEGLPPCPPFDDTMFFATPGLGAYAQFAEAVFPAKSIPCTVFLDGKDAELSCLFDLDVALTWTWPEGHFPFSDGDVVRLYMEYGNYDPPTFAMAIWDLDNSLLALASPSSFVFSAAAIDCTDVDTKVNVSYVDGYSCEYDLAEAPPIAWPDSGDSGCCGWTRVFGLSGSGHYAESEWDLEYPGETVASGDGEYFVTIPVNYSGETYDEEIPDFAGIKQEFAFQLVKRWD